MAAAVDGAHLSVAACTELARIVKNNKFKLKDEDYLEDSGDELKREKAKLEEGPRAEDNKEFDPLGYFKLDQLQDIEKQIAVKKEEDDKLEEWRRRREKKRSDALRQFKEEQDTYRRVKRARGRNSEHEEATNSAKATESDGRALNESERALQRGQEPPVETLRPITAQQNVTKTVEDDDGFEFDPFAMLRSDEPPGTMTQIGSAQVSNGRVEEVGPYGDEYHAYDEEQIEEFAGDEGDFNMMNDPF